MTPISDDMVERGARVHNPLAFDPETIWATAELTAIAQHEARREVREILTAALEGSVAVPAWRFDVEDAPKDRPYLVAMLDDEKIEYHVAKAIGVGKATIIIGGAFGFDRSGKVFAWRDIDPVASALPRQERSGEAG